MATETVATFESSLDELGVGVTRTDREGFNDALAAIVDEPAVGVPLRIDGVPLDDVPVTVDPTPAQLESARTGVTPVGTAVATYGTLAIESTSAGDEAVSLFPERHVAVVREEDVVWGLDEAFARLDEGFDAGRDSVVFATGASATADMGEMVEGVHGPAAVHVVVLDS